MSQDILKQSISALMDNEADEMELRRVLNAIDDPQVRADWSSYHAARAAMHNETAYAQVDLSASIMAAIDAEQAPLVDQQTTAAPIVKKNNMQWLSRVAVAASVTLAVLGGVRFYNQDTMQQDAMVAQSEQRLPAHTQAHTPTQAKSHTQGSVVLASYAAQGQKAPIVEAVDGQDAWYERRLPSYLRQHAQQTGVNKTESGLPDARAASLEGH
jgi:sigma-E factor negative regulatory protein RseA